MSVNDKCRSAINTTLSSCNTQCSSSTLNDPNCTDCLCQQCENLSNLGQGVTDDAKECCKGISCKKKTQYGVDKGCFDQCSGNVDSSSYTSELFDNCCNSTEHQNCCLKSCLTSQAYQATKLPSLFSAKIGNDPISKYCQGKEVFRSVLPTAAYDNTKPYCQQTSSKQSQSALYDCACQSGSKPCLEALDYETCTLLNTKEIMNCLNSKGGQDLINGKNELDGLFCKQQNMGFPCRSCLICNYINNVNPDLKTQLSQIKESYTESPTASPSPTKSDDIIDYIIYSSIVIIIIMIIKLAFVYFKK